MKLQIGVVFGGKSVEHDISIITALQVMKALDPELYDIIPIYLSKENRWYTSPSFLELSTFQKQVKLDEKEEIYFYQKNGGYYYRGLKKKFNHGLKIDLILPTVHGMGVEDGTIAGFFEILGIPITSASQAASALVQDKAWTKDILTSVHIPTLPYTLIRKEDETLDVKLSMLSLPVIIKPARLGSSIGITVARTKEDIYSGLELAFAYDDKVIIESLIEEVREFNCAVFKTSLGYEVSEVEEIKAGKDFYAFSDKYENDFGEVGKMGDANRRACPAHIDVELTEEIKELALATFKALELKGVSRVDFLYDEKNAKLFINEVNTIPGSLSFYLFEKRNISFRELLNHLIKAALIDHKQKEKRITSFTSSALNRDSLCLKK